MDKSIPEKVLRYETFVNDVLKENLKAVEKNLNLKITELAEWKSLKDFIAFMNESEMPKGFKTKVDIGTNIYVQAVVPDISSIIIDVGCGVHVEYTLSDALVVVDSRIQLLENLIMEIKKNSSFIKARIKFVLHGIQELENIK